MKLRNRILLTTVSFLAICAFFAICAWASGFNFDHRDEKVGDVTSYAFAFSALVAMAVFLMTTDNP